MHEQRLTRFNDLLLEASSRGRPIDDLDEIPSWFVGTPEVVTAKVQEVRSLFDEAYNNGLINRWIEEHANRDPSTHWDWASAAHRKAQARGMTLADPLGNPALFAHVPNRITTPTETIRMISADALDEDACNWLNRVYEEHVRYIVRYEGRPVAALLPLVDLELLKDIQAQVDPCKWLEWIQEIRLRLGWPPVTFQEEGPAGTQEHCLDDSRDEQEEEGGTP